MCLPECALAALLARLVEKLLYLSILPLPLSPDFPSFSASVISSAKFSSLHQNQAGLRHSPVFFSPDIETHVKPQHEGV